MTKLIWLAAVGPLLVSAAAFGKVELTNSKKLEICNAIGIGMARSQPLTGLREPLVDEKTCLAGQFVVVDEDDAEIEVQFTGQLKPKSPRWQCTVYNEHPVNDMDPTFEFCEPAPAGR